MNSLRVFRLSGVTQEDGETVDALYIEYPLFTNLTSLNHFMRGEGYESDDSLRFTRTQGDQTHVVDVSIETMSLEKAKRHNTALAVDMFNTLYEDRPDSTEAKAAQYIIDVLTAI